MSHPPEKPEKSPLNLDPLLGIGNVGPPQSIDGKQKILHERLINIFDQMQRANNRLENYYRHVLSLLQIDSLMQRIQLSTPSIYEDGSMPPPTQRPLIPQVDIHLIHELAEFHNSYYSDQNVREFFRRLVFELSDNNGTLAITLLMPMFADEATPDTLAVMSAVIMRLRKPEAPALSLSKILKRTEEFVSTREFRTITLSPQINESDFMLIAKEFFDKLSTLLHKELTELDYKKSQIDW